MATLFDRFSPPARQAVTLAQDEARALGHAYLGTEHLLLGLLGQTTSVAAAALAVLGVEPQAVRAAVERIIGRGGDLACGQLCLTPRLKKVFALAAKEAKPARQHAVEPEHLLLGLLAEGEGVAAAVLGEQGVSLARVREVLPAARAAAAHGPTTPPHTDAGTRRYTLVFPEELFGQVERLATAEHTTVVELLRRFTKLGLLAAEVQRTPGASLLIRDGEGERQIVLL